MESTSVICAGVETTLFFILPFPAYNALNYALGLQPVCLKVRAGKLLVACGPSAMGTTACRFPDTWPSPLNLRIRLWWGTRWRNRSCSSVRRPV